MPGRPDDTGGDLLLMAKAAPAATTLVILNMLAFFLSMKAGALDDIGVMVKIGANYAPAVLQGEVWRFLTAMFLHFDLKHLFSNMLGLFFLGGLVEQEFRETLPSGSLRFVVLYLVSGLFASLVSFLSSLLSGSYPVSAGASGAVFGTIAGLAMIVIKRKGRFRNLRPANVVFMVLYSIFSGFTTAGIDNAAHIGGFLSGLVLTALLYRDRHTPPDAV